MPHLPIYWTRFSLPVSILVAFCSVAVLAVLTFRNTVRLRDGERQVSKSHAIGEATHRLLSALKDAQTGERGFIITGKPVFLEPFDRGRQKLEESWQDLSRLTSDQPDLNSQVNQLKQLLDRKVGYLDEAVALRSRELTFKPSEKVIEMVNSEEGEKLMEAVRDATSSILDRQAERLNDTERRSEQLSAVSYRAILLGNLIALVIISTTGAISYWDRHRRDQSEATLAAKESELSAIFDSTSDAILSFDHQLHIRLVNPSACQLLGFQRPDEAVGLALTSLIEAQTPQGPVQRFVDSDLHACQFTGTGKRSDGKSFPMEGRFAKLESNGRRYHILVFQDLTELQRAESSRRELAAILDQVNDAIVVCDLHGQVVSWNQGAEALHGVPASQAIGRPARELMCAASPTTWEHGSTHVLSHAVYSTEFEMAKPNKDQQWIEHRRSLIRDTHGTAIGQLIMHIDITERRQQEAKERRGQRLESLGTLAGGVAHDLNNILTPILMNAKLAQRSHTNQARLLEMIVTSAERGGKMIKKLLAFAGGDRASVEMVHVRDVVHEVEEILGHALPKTIRLKTEIADDLWQVLADPTELSQVIVNLAVNARDAMPEGGWLTIEARNCHVSAAANLQAASGCGDFVLVTVSDQGHGISPEIIERIFDPFFSTKAQGKGTGLGLATSLGIVRAYGGDILVESTPGVGSLFSVYLPVGRSPQAPHQRLAGKALEPLGRGERILLVDDEPNIVESAGELLSNSGYHPVFACSGAQAIEKLLAAAEPIDLVVLDIMMPEMDGLETKERLRAIKPNLKIIASSGLRRPGVDERLNDLDGFLAKPYRNHELLQLVRETLDADSAQG